MSDQSFHIIAHEYLKRDVEVITLQGTFTGRLLSVGKDIIVLESRGRIRHVEIVIRIETIVAIFRAEAVPRGPFGFNPMAEENEHERTESNDKR